MPPFDNRPFLFRLGKAPFAITETIILFQVIGMLITVASKFTSIEATQFSVERILAGEVWRLVSYQLFEGPSLMWGLGLFFFYNFGKHVESALGQKGYIQLIIGCILIPSATGVLLAQLPFTGATTGFLGNQILSTSVFCAAVSMMPNQKAAILSIPLKWLALAIVCIILLQFLASSFWIAAWMAASGVLFAVMFMMKHGLAVRNFGFETQFLSKKKARTQNPKRSRRQKPKIRPRSQLTTQNDSEVDLILEKISEHGFQSLSSKEKEKLKQASKRRS